MRKDSFLWWSSVGLTSCSWIFLSSIYHAPLFISGIVCLLAAIGLAVRAVRITDVSPLRGSLFAAIALPVATAALFPLASWESRLPLLILSIGLVGIQLRKTLMKRLAVGISFVGLVSTLQVGVMGLYKTFLADKHFSLPLSFFDYWIPRLFGVRTTAIGQEVFFPSQTGYVAVTASWDQLALIYGLIATCGALVLIAFGGLPGRRWREALRSLLITGVYLLLRRLALVLFFLEGSKLSIFWNPTITFFSVLPLFVLLWVFVRTRTSTIILNLRRVLQPSTLRSTVPVFALVFLGTLASLASLYLAIPGVRNGNVLWFDEAHGDWESTLKAMDKDWYGMQSTYNYHSLYEWLAYYYDVGRVEEPITEDILKHCDILVVKTPSKSYSETEIDAIVQYVRHGGGLFVIGDHTNVFGTTTSLNALLRRFGLALNYDATYELATGYFTRFITPPHSLNPVMQHTDHFQFLTSCSIRVPWQAWRVITDGPIIASHADYSTEDFFAGNAHTLNSAFGVFVQAAAIPYGRGRVLVFSDSTCFSNFSVHMGGYPRFLLATLGFLGYQNPRVPVRLVFLGLSLGCALFVGVWMIRKGAATCILMLITGVTLGWTMFLVIGTSIHGAFYPLPQPDRDIPYVYFDLLHSECIVAPQPSRKRDDTRDHFETFFVWTQRVSQVPVLIDDSADVSPIQERPYVIINPTHSLTPSFLNDLKKYVEQEGGRLVLMDRSDSDLVGLTEILKPFTLQIGLSGNSQLILSGPGVDTNVLERSGPVTVSTAKRGKGVVVLLSDSGPFSNASLGGAFTQPSTAQRDLYDVEFFLFEELLN